MKFVIYQFSQVNPCHSAWLPSSILLLFPSRKTNKQTKENANMLKHTTLLACNFITWITGSLCISARSPYCLLHCKSKTILFLKIAYSYINKYISLKIIDLQICSTPPPPICPLTSTQIKIESLFDKSGIVQPIMPFDRNINQPFRKNVKLISLCCLWIPAVYVQGCCTLLPHLAVPAKWISVWVTVRVSLALALRLFWVHMMNMS